MSYYQSTVLPDAPLAYWRLDETSGTTAKDISGNSNNGTISASGVTKGMPSGLVYDADTSMFFNGNGQITGSISSMPSGAGTWSMEAWINFAKIGSLLQMIMNIGTFGVNNQSAFLCMDTSGFAQIGTFNGNHSSSTLITLGIWHHIVGTYDGTNMRLYLDGQLILGPVAQTMALTGTGFAIASSQGGLHDPMIGFIDEVTVYGTTLSLSRIQAHYNAGRTYASRYDLQAFKEQQVLVYDQSGNFVDCVRDAPLLAGFKETINGVTSPLKVQLPRKFESLDLPATPGGHGIMQQGYIWKYSLFGPGLPSGGLLRYSGQVDAYEPQIASSGEETIAITLTPRGSAIADHGITGNAITFGTVGQSGTYVDPITQFNYFFSHTDPVTNKYYCDPLTLDGSNPSSSGVTRQFSYQNQTIKSIFDNIILMLPANYFYRVNADNSVTLNQTPLTAQHTLLVGVHCSDPQYSQSWVPMRNAVYFVGNNVSTTVRGGDMTTIGERLDYINENRVSDLATANALAAGYLNYYDRPMLRTKIRVPDYRGPSPSVGFDIESLKVGDSIQLQDNTYNGASTLWDNFNWDVGIWDLSPGPAFNVVGVISSISYSFFYVDLEIGLPQPNLQRDVSRIRQQFQDFTVL